ncbi:CDP-diacylglycerol--glycerol-3-phosphate 3-phosphatidyltransferase [Vigna angularis]|uniref:CDP-diacylglycerol--glycerol-3-phosphate 3-phosphatidyltransferase n=1 Tax=Phaseolus angularis TaxID=3914 RepID=A0A8T0KWD8_PHAAN|nr:CDP-diacylglycerol--glycerol-3-phosphate 3-phosphatidyltransferase [Vigna angularis]
MVAEMNVRELSISKNDRTSMPAIANSKFLTLPTILTLGRVASIPLLVATFFMDGWRGTVVTTSIFTAAAVTDWLDGYIARKMKMKSTFGAFLDPVADKLMVSATLVLLCTRPLEVAVFGQLPWLLIIPSITIIGREIALLHLGAIAYPRWRGNYSRSLESVHVSLHITMSALREWAASQGSKLLEVVAVNNLGKWKTATQMLALIILLATRDCSRGGPAILVGSGVVLLYISAGLSLWSFVVYTREICKVLRR